MERGSRLSPSSRSPCASRGRARCPGGADQRPARAARRTPPPEAEPGRADLSPAERGSSAGSKRIAVGNRKEGGRAGMFTACRAQPAGRTRFKAGPRSGNRCFLYSEQFKKNDINAFSVSSFVPLLHPKERKSRPALVGLPQARYQPITCE